MVAAVTRYFSRRLRRVARDVQQRTGSIAHVLEEIVGGHRIIKIFGGHDYERTRAVSAANKLRQSMAKQSSASAASSPLLQFVGACAVGFIVYLVLKQSETGGFDAARFGAYVAGLLTLLDRLRSMSGVNTNIQRGSVSVGSVAVELAEKIFESLCDRQVMVIGAGDTSEKTARALLSRGAHSIIVSNRSYDRAKVLARELNGRAIQFDEWAEEFKKIDIVISSTAAPHYILDRVKLEPLMKLRKNQPLLLIDIAVPRDIEPEVNFLENVYLYNIDDLQAIADDYLKQRREEIARCETIIRDKVGALLGAERHPHSASSLPSGLGHESIRAA